MTARRWCFTLNNYQFVPVLSDFNFASYLCYGEEHGEEGTPHLQGYIEFSQPVRRNSVLEALPGAHVEKAVRDSTTNITYCSKGGIFTEEGTPSRGQGSRSDLIEIKGKLDRGASLIEIADDHFSSYIRYSKGLTSYKFLKATRRDWPMELVFIIGPTRTGKSRTARDLGGPDAYWKDNTKWWDGYHGQHTVIWDEFYGSSCSFIFLLRLLDRYPLSTETKGGVLQFSSHRIIFTSNQLPEDWYDSEKTHHQAWEESPLYARIREFGRVIYTGDVHRRVRPQLAQPNLYGHGLQ